MALRRGHGEGSYYQRSDGRWEARVSVSGRRRSFYGPTKRDVMAKVREASARPGYDLSSLDSRQTIAQFLTYWLTQVEEPRIGPLTYQSHETAIRLHILPLLGRLRLSSLTPQQLQALYGELASEGLSGATVARVHAVLHAALGHAVLVGALGTNPADRVGKPRAGQREMRTLTFGEVVQLVNATGDPTRRALYAVAATAGLRRGELLGLSWRDTDLALGRVHIQRTLQRLTGEGLVFLPPKTDHGRRTVDLTKFAIEALKADRAAQRETRLRAGPSWNGQEDLVFASSVGTPMEASYLSKLFKRDLEAAGLGQMRFHELRHTAATLLLGSGTSPKVAQEMLGHSRVAITLDLYSHVQPTLQAEAVAVLDRLLEAAR
jgi:integrase